MLNSFHTNLRSLWLNVHLLNKGQRWRVVNSIHSQELQPLIKHTDVQIQESVMRRIFKRLLNLTQSEYFLCVAISLSLVLDMKFNWEHYIET